MREQKSQPYLDEMREFAAFTGREQRYIRCALEIYHKKSNEELLFSHWGRGSNTEKAFIKVQSKVYHDHLPTIRLLIPETNHLEYTGFCEWLILVSIFDLRRDILQCFSAYRFLYERLLTARIRPWLPAAFVAAAAMPSIEPERRELLLTSISKLAATAHGWSLREPVFFPEWVEKDPVN